MHPECSRLDAQGGLGVGCRRNAESICAGSCPGRKSRRVAECGVGFGHETLRASWWQTPARVRKRSCADVFRADRRGLQESRVGVVSEPLGSRCTAASELKRLRTGGQALRRRGSDETGESSQSARGGFGRCGADEPRELAHSRDPTTPSDPHYKSIRHDALLNEPRKQRSRPYTTTQRPPASPRAPTPPDLTMPPPASMQRRQRQQSAPPASNTHATSVTLHFKERNNPKQPLCASKRALRAPPRVRGGRRRLTARFPSANCRPLQIAPPHSGGTVCTLSVCNCPYPSTDPDPTTCRVFRLARPLRPPFTASLAVDLGLRVEVQLLALLARRTVLSHLGQS